MQRNQVLTSVTHYSGPRKATALFTMSIISFCYVKNIVSVSFSTASLLLDRRHLHRILTTHYSQYLYCGSKIFRHACPATSTQICGMPANGMPKMQCGAIVFFSMGALVLGTSAFLMGNFFSVAAWPVGLAMGAGWPCPH